MLKAKATSAPHAFIPGERQPQPSVQFDFDRVESPVMDEEDATKDKLHRVINAVCEWLYPPRCRQATVLLRAYAFVWFLRPEWIGNPSQVELARKLNVSKQCLGKVINQLRDQFGFYVAGMRGDDAREKFAANAKRHAKSLAQSRKAAFLKR